MSHIRNLVSKVRRSAEEGATAVEYGIMVALIAAVIVAVIVVLGQQVKQGFCKTSSNLAGTTGIAKSTDCT